MFSPVVIFAYNRKEHLEKLIKSLHLNKEASRTDLIIFCDGKKNDSQSTKTEEVKNFVNHINGFKSVKKNLPRKKHRTCQQYHQRS